MAGRGRLKAAVYVQDPTTREELILLPGDYPEPGVAALITNPDAWEEPPDDCDEPEETVVVEKFGPSGNKDGGQEETAGTGGARKSPSRRGAGRSASSSS
ncbi:hypothetical protein ACFVOK_12085 [Streptomyces sp. NPDC057798]|uniref:hypothetical protein n=1 Tax=unclassified Streptomyces TaxID=2593676 RepID=UPI0006E159FD|nr:MULTISPECIES: hypothetical protein [unclassified Streptomyces]TVL91983.1 hypothetical protein CD790_15045 [Streptomyces sp. SAJ15]